MKTLSRTLIAITLLLVLPVVFAQNISGNYVAEFDGAPMKLHLTTSDDNISAQLKFESRTIDLLGVREADALIFDTEEFSFTMKGKLVEDTIEMVIVEIDETIELTFERYEPREAARAPQNTLSNLLQFVPATAEVLTSEITYLNLWALSGFRNAPIIQSQQDFVDHQDTYDFKTYMDNTFLVTSTPFDSRAAIPLLDDMPETVGFSWFEIAASLNYGTLPKKGHLVISSANPTDISSALANLDFEEQQFQDYPFWTSGEDGSMNIENLNRANPFGGNLGSAAKVLLVDDVIGYARFNEIIQNQIRSYSQDVQSLTELPGFAFLVNELQETDDVLFQTHFTPLQHLVQNLVDPATLLLQPLADTEELREKFLNPENSFSEHQQVLFDALLESEDKLPLPQQVALAHYFKDDADYNTTYATIALLYNDKDAAMISSEILFERLSLYHESFETIDVQANTVTSSSSGEYHLVTVKVENLKQSIFEDGDRPFEPFSRWINDIYRGQFLPLFFF